MGKVNDELGWYLGKAEVFADFCRKEGMVIIAIENQERSAVLTCVRLLMIGQKKKE